MPRVVLPNTTIALLNDFVSKQRERTIGWLRAKMNLRKHDAEDVFQDAFMVLYENLTKGTLAQVPESLGAYINEVCRRKAMEVIRANDRAQGRGTIEADDERRGAEGDGEESSMSDDWDDSLLEEVAMMGDPLAEEGSDEEGELINGPQEEAERIERKEAAVREVVQDLPDPCNKLLWGFYFEKYSMDDMAKMYGYRSANSVKTLKNRCMNKFAARMRELYSNMFND